MCHWAGIAILCITRGVERPPRGPRWGGASRARARPRPAGRASRPAPASPRAIFPLWLSPRARATSLLLSQAPGGGKLEPLSSRRFQQVPLAFGRLSPRGGITPGAPRAPQAARSRSPHGSSLPCTCERANRSAPSKPAPGWRPLLDLNRPRLLSFTFESHDWYLYGSRGARLGRTCPPIRPEGGTKERPSTWARERAWTTPQTSPRGARSRQRPLIGVSLAPHGDGGAAATFAGPAPARAGECEKRGPSARAPAHGARSLGGVGNHRRAAAAAAGRPFKSPGSFAWPRPPVTRLARAGPSPLPLGRSF